jgi:hypothetical protein
MCLFSDDVARAKETGTLPSRENLWHKCWRTFRAEEPGAELSCPPELPSCGRRFSRGKGFHKVRRLNFHSGYAASRFLSVGDARANGLFERFGFPVQSNHDHIAPRTR